MKIFETKPLEAPNGEPGSITIADSRIIVGCGDGSLEILSLQAPGKRRISTSDYLRGAHLTAPHFK